MRFRSHHRLALAAATLSAAGLMAAAPQAAPWAPAGAHAAGRPNIVLIQTDDQTFSQFKRRVMPNTKRLLSDHGTRFTDYIASTAQCCPSRASLITGQYAHNHGVLSNNIGYAGLVDKGNVLPAWLQQAGYRTMHVGKFLNGYLNFADPPTEVAPGWDEWYSVLGSSSQYYNYDLYINGTVVHRGSRPGDHVTHVLNTKAVKLVKRFAPENQPFYLELDERAPHTAQQPDPMGNCGKSAIPLPRDEGRFRDAGPPKPPSFDEPDMSDKPSFLSSAPKLDAKAKRKIDKRWPCALASLFGVDRGVANVYQAVEESGELPKTVFIFISDNGQFYGEHRIPTGKVFPYEEALRLPLVIKLPTRYRDGATRVRKVGRPVANIDLAPTILDLARAHPCASAGNCRTMDGRSLMPLLTRSGGWPGGRGVLTEYRVPDLGRYSTCEFAGIRTRNDIYVRHFRAVDPSTGQCVAVDQRERYHLTTDPFELDNMCFGGNAAACPIDTFLPGGLQSRLNSLRSCAGVEGRDRQTGGRPFCE